MIVSVTSLPGKHPEASLQSLGQCMLVPTRLDALESHNAHGYQCVVFISKAIAASIHRGYLVLLCTQTAL